MDEVSLQELGSSSPEVLCSEAPRLIDMGRVKNSWILSFLVQKREQVRSWRIPILPSTRLTEKKLENMLVYRCYILS